MGKYTKDNPDIEDAKGNRASKEKAHQPKNADYAYWHKNGYPVLVGDGSNPSQKARRKHRPAGVPILFKIDASAGDKAAIKKIAEERKLEYDRLYHRSRAETSSSYSSRKHLGADAESRKKANEALKEMKADRKKSNNITKQIEELNENYAKTQQTPDGKTEISKKADSRRKAYNNMSQEERKSSRGKNLKKQLDKYEDLRRKEAADKKETKKISLEVLSDKIKKLEKKRLGILIGEENTERSAKTIQDFVRKIQKNKKDTKEDKEELQKRKDKYTKIKEGGLKPNEMFQKPTLDAFFDGDGSGLTQSNFRDKMNDFATSTGKFKSADTLLEAQQQNKKGLPTDVDVLEGRDKRGQPKRKYVSKLDIKQIEKVDNDLVERNNEINRNVKKFLEDKDLKGSRKKIVDKILEIAETKTYGELKAFTLDDLDTKYGKDKFDKFAKKSQRPEEIDKWNKLAAREASLFYRLKQAKLEQMLISQQFKIRHREARDLVEDIFDGFIKNGVKADLKAEKEIKKQIKVAAFKEEEQNKKQKEYEKERDRKLEEREEERERNRKPGPKKTDKNLSELRMMFAGYGVEYRVEKKEKEALEAQKKRIKELKKVQNRDKEITELFKSRVGFNVLKLDKVKDNFDRKKKEFDEEIEETLELVKKRRDAYKDLKKELSKKEVDVEGLNEAIEKSNLDNKFLVEGEEEQNYWKKIRNLGGVNTGIADLNRRDVKRALEKGGVVKAIEVIDNHRRGVEKNVEEGMKIVKTNRKKLDEYTDYLFGVLEEDIKIRKEKK